MDTTIEFINQILIMLGLLGFLSLAIEKFRELNTEIKYLKLQIKQYKREEKGK